MKKNLYILLILSLTFVTSACSDFLNREPISDITDEMLGINPNATSDSIKYNTKELLEAILSSAYYNFQSEYYQLDRYLINDAQSDNCYSGEPKSQTTQIDQYTIDPTNGNVSRDWRYMYQQITSANSVIQWAPLNTDSNLTETRRKEIIGEASFIRAVAYFNLVRIYGGVPVILKEIPTITNQNLETVYPLLFPSRQSVDSVYKVIISDLETAINYCKDYSANKFVATKPLAHAVLAEVYATKGAPDNIEWDKVQQHAHIVNNDPHYGLMENFDDLWAPAEDGSGLKYEHCKESLFEVDCNSWSTIGNWAYQMFIGTDWKKFDTPSKDIVKAFTDENDNVRYHASIIYQDITGKWSDQVWPSNNYPFCYKLRLNEKGNIIIWRLASSILLEAEAENELGNLSAARGLINQIRRRVHLQDVVANNKEEMRLAIEKERRLELAFEGYRWFDLLRTERAISVMKNCTDVQKEYALKNLTENRLIWPIPQTELDQNNNLTQNPGY